MSRWSCHRNSSAEWHEVAPILKSTSCSSISPFIKPFHEIGHTKVCVVASVSPPAPNAHFPLMSSPSRLSNDTLQLINLSLRTSKRPEL